MILCVHFPNISLKTDLYGHVRCTLNRIQWLNLFSIFNYGNRLRFKKFIQGYIFEQSQASDR